MYKKNRITGTSLKVSVVTEGETIENKIRRITNNEEPITDGAPLVYTDRKDGVRPEHDIRTDRFEIAVEAMDKVTKDAIAKREARQQRPEGIKVDKGEGGSLDGTEGGNAAEPGQK